MDRLHDCDDALRYLEQASLPGPKTRGTATQMTYLDGPYWQLVRGGERA
jgi:hypothetical protein